MNGLEPEEFMEDLSSQMLPNNHAAVRRVEKVVNRILVANADVKELEGKKFGVSVINSTVENAFVIPAENMSYIHLLDILSLGIITAIWAVIPSDILSLLSNWLFSKCIKLFLELPYSRKMEVEADLVGLLLAAKACFDVRESSAFWNKMAFLTEKFGFDREIEFLSTHPSHEKRSEYLDTIMEQALQLRTSCGCPRLSYKDPRIDVATMKASLELSRKKIEQNQKPKNIFKH